LTGSFIYSGGALAVGVSALDPMTNLHYEELDRNFRNRLEEVLIQTPQTVVGIPAVETAGVLTSRAWGLAHLIAGTNRRAIHRTFQEFLCRPIGTMKDTTVPGTYIRRDVERAPGGSVNTFRTECQSCHAGMDAMGGAFAKFTFFDNRLRHGDEVGGETPDNNDGPIFERANNNIAQKMNRAGDVFPEGRITRDSSWINLWANNASVGWRGPQSGVGVKAFGSLMASTKSFSSCMVKRAFHAVCGRKTTSVEESQMSAIADRLEGQHGYILKRVFEEVAILPTCIKK